MKVEVKMEYKRGIVGNVIREYRTRKRISQEVLSGRADIPRSHLSDIENGKVIPRLDTIWAICDALGVSPSKLISVAEEYMIKN